MEDLIRKLRNQKPFVIKHVEKNGIDSVSLFCAVSHFNLIVAYTFIAEEFEEYEEECRENIRRIKQFYKIEEV